MKWYNYIICTICIIFGVFSIITLTDIWSERSGVYGSISEDIIKQKTETSIFAEFDISQASFETEDYINYTSVVTFEPKAFNGKTQNYYLIFNDSVCSDTELHAGKIISKITLKFYNAEGSIASIVEMNVIIEFNEDKTTIKLITKNEASSISYLEKYISIHGASFKIIERGEKWIN